MVRAISPPKNKFYTLTINTMRTERKQLTWTTVWNRYVIWEPIEVIRPNGKKWRKEKCICKLCWKEKYVDRQHLLTWKTKSCGCNVKKVYKWEKYWEREVIEDQIWKMAKCKCSCWTIRYVRCWALKIWWSLWCWCTRSHYMKHGLCKTPFYEKYLHAKARCENKNCERYNCYWWRWIKVERETFEEFKNDMYESYLEHCKEYWEKDTTLDRIDVNGNYCKENCRWATRYEQMNNTQKSKKVKYMWVEYLSVSDLCHKIWREADRAMIDSRIRRWISPEEAVLLPRKFNVKKV